MSSSFICKSVLFVSFAGQDVFLDYCQKLLEKFRYPWELMPLMYVILKDAGADIDEASRRIEEGKPKETNYFNYLLSK